MAMREGETCQCANTHRFPALGSMDANVGGGSPRGFHASGRQPSTSSESFKTHGFDVVVDNVEGFLCKIRMKAAVDLPCEEVPITPVDCCCLDTLRFWTICNRSIMGCI
jgi:hypothetical protein